MEWVNKGFEFVKFIGGLTTLLSPIFLFFYSYANRRILTNKLDNLITFFMIFICNFIIHLFFVALIIYQQFFVDNRWTFYNDSLTVFLLGMAAFILFIGILIELVFEMKIRISFSLFKVGNISGLLLKQKVTESHRILQYQELDDIVEENKVSKFYKKINRERGFPVTEEYKEHNYFVSDVIFRLRNIRIMKKKISLLSFVILRWVLIIFVGIIGLIKVPGFIDKNIWVFSNLFIIAFITIFKNFICIKEVYKHNEELIRKEYENLNANNV
ncbi:hypothetical protein ACTRV7_03805 [Staphylococcus xylosus]|uniref:hypothetical protein n=1 Tax=Staphylococcus xylosus TaxID=1288 RepID=UPI003F94C507